MSTKHFKGHFKRLCADVLQYNTDRVDCEAFLASGDLGECFRLLTKWSYRYLKESPPTYTRFLAAHAEVQASEEKFRKAITGSSRLMPLPEIRHVFTKILHENKNFDIKKFAHYCNHDHSSFCTGRKKLNGYLQLGYDSWSVNLYWHLLTHLSPTEINKRKASLQDKFESVAFLGCEISQEDLPTIRKVLYTVLKNLDLIDPRTPISLPAPQSTPREIPALIALANQIGII